MAESDGNREVDAQSARFLAQVVRESHAKPAHEQHCDDAPGREFQPGLDAQGIEFWMEVESFHNEVSNAW